MTRIFEQFHWVLALIFCATLGSAPPALAEDYSRTCQYFAGQAFKDRRAGRETTFPMELAQDCVDALIYLRSEDAAARARAGDYLVELENFRALTVEMLVARARERDPGKASLNRHVRPAVTPISWAGAYLIARRMGLVDTHHDWTEWRQSIALADPRLRIE